MGTAAFRLVRKYVGEQLRGGWRHAARPVQLAAERAEIRLVTAE